jgi:hypothetical protein
VAFNIQKYISVGGQIRDEKSLKKIYGIDTNTLNDILPFIIFPEKPELLDSSSFKKTEKRNSPILRLTLYCNGRRPG